MNITKWRVLSLIGALVLIGGLALATWTVDQMALAYLTGQRRVPGKDWFGREVRMQGPPPGFLFLGFSKPSDSGGFEITTPADTGLEIGIKTGDEVLSVDGKQYRSGIDLVGYLLAEKNGGETVSVRIRQGKEESLIELKLKTFYRSPADLGLRFEDVELRSKSGYVLRGWYIPPPSDGDGRAGIFVHGANSSRFQALDGAIFWHRRGYGLLVTDLSGRGTSEGDYITYTLNERQDVISMVEFLWDRPDVAADKTVVFGTSNGAASVIYAAADILDLPAIVLDSPYSDLWTAAGEMLSARGFYPQLVHPLSWAVWWRAGVKLKTIRPIEAIERVPAAALFVHGDADTQVPPYHSEQMHKLRLKAGLPSQRWVIPGGRHGFDKYPPLEEFWDKVIDFCDQQIGGPPGTSSEQSEVSPG